MYGLGERAARSLNRSKRQSVERAAKRVSLVFGGGNFTQERKILG